MSEVVLEKEGQAAIKGQNSVKLEWNNARRAALYVLCLSKRVTSGLYPTSEALCMRGEARNRD
jgi:hypothetical protein